jgi:hypothetical protein
MVLPIHLRALLPPRTLLFMSWCLTQHRKSWNPAATTSASATCGPVMPGLSKCPEWTTLRYVASCACLATPTPRTKTAATTLRWAVMLFPFHSSCTIGHTTPGTSTVPAIILVYTDPLPVLQSIHHILIFFLQEIQTTAAKIQIKCQSTEG